MNESSDSQRESVGFDPDKLDWDKGAGLLPAIVQDADGGAVLMLGYMNREALDATRESGKVTFFSRSKQRLWTKGESSGNFLELQALRGDCDNDTILVTARALGPACHRGTQSCFGDHSAPKLSFIADLDALIAARERERPADSYTTKLFEQGLRRIAQKVGEEGVETALAAVAQDEAATREEAADLVFHLLVLLRARGIALGDVVDVLRARHAAKS